MPVHKKNKVDIEGEEKEDVPTLPVEVLEHILSYIKYPDILSFREYSPLFNELITGYRTPNVFGVQNKPQNCIHTYFWLIGHEIDFLFSKLKDYRPDNIPSFPFYRLMGEIRNLDPAFWPHLQGTNVQVINLSANAIEDTKATNFSQSLRGTRVKEVELMANIIEGIQAINLQGTRVHTVGLSYNQITAAGGTREFAQNLRGTEVKEVDLTGNQIGDAGVIELAQNLQGTEVRKIFLADTNISDHGAVELSRNLRGTKVKEVDLSGNQIGNAKLIELAQNLQGTEVKTINLSGNEIGDVGVIEFAQNLQETNVEEVILWSNNITQEVMELLFSQYPNIVWFG